MTTKTNPGYLIDDKHLREVCKPGHGAATCRYIMCSADGFECAKHQPGFATVVDSRVLQGTMVAQAINCDGKTRLQ